MYRAHSSSDLEL